MRTNCYELACCFHHTEITTETLESDGNDIQEGLIGHIRRHIPCCLYNYGIKPTSSMGSWQGRSIKDKLGEIRRYWNTILDE